MPLAFRNGNSGSLRLGHSLYNQVVKISILSPVLLATLMLVTGCRKDVQNKEAPRSGGPPAGFVDLAGDLQGGTTVAKGGTLYVRGWAADTASGAPLQSVTVYVDGSSAGNATLGISRPDVAKAFDRSDYTNSGWNFQMSTATLSVGAHSVTATATGTSGTGPLTRTKTVNITP